MSINALHIQIFLSLKTLKLLSIPYDDFSIYTKNMDCTLMSK